MDFFQEYPSIIDQDETPYSAEILQADRSVFLQYPIAPIAPMNLNNWNYPNTFAGPWPIEFSLQRSIPPSMSNRRPDLTHPYQTGFLVPSRHIDNCIDPSLDQIAIDEALIAAGSDLTVQLDEFDRQNPDFLSGLTHSQSYPTYIVPLPHVAQGNPGGICSHDGEMSKMKIEDFEDEHIEELDTMSSTKSEDPQSDEDGDPLMYAHRASQRKARTRSWPRRSDMNPSFPMRPRSFREYILGGKFGHAGEDSGRNLMALYGNDVVPRTRYAIRINRGRLKPIYPTRNQYPSSALVIPGGTTLEEICQNWPLHVWGSGLRLFMAEGWSSEQIWKLLPLAVRRSGDAHRPWNYLQQAMGRECDRIWVEEGQPRRMAKKRRIVGTMRLEQGDRLIGAAPSQSGMIEPSADQHSMKHDPEADLPHSIPGTGPTTHAITSRIVKHDETDIVSPEHRVLVADVQREQASGWDLELRLRQMIDPQYVGMEPQRQQQYAAEHLRKRLHSHRDRLRRRYGLQHISSDRALELYRAIHRMKTGWDPASVEDITARMSVQCKENTYALKRVKQEQQELNAYLRRRVIESTGGPTLASANPAQG